MAGRTTTHYLASACAVSGRWKCWRTEYTRRGGAVGAGAFKTGNRLLHGGL
jgi:hypothetical protein